ncbi:nosip, partial [Symbiodinium necroappetens]
MCVMAVYQPGMERPGDGEDMPGRLLAMSWQQAAFDAEDGTVKLLRRLASSETLVHEEFVEALIRLHEEKLGISQADRDFGLPPIEESWSDYEWGDQAWEDGSWWYYEDELNSEKAKQQLIIQEPILPNVSERPPDLRRAIDELTIADSFIMGVLRGWRLLQAAGLTPEEKRDILSTSRNSLDYEVIAQALQGLWDEQLLGNRHGGPGGRDYQCHANYHEEMDTYYSEEPNDWYPEETGWWDHQGYAAEWDDEPWWTTPYDDAFPTTMEEPNEIDDEKVKEAQQAERVAEQLAMEARRTWSEAQKATQALKRDRGFGAISSNSGGGRCFNCGGPHFARDCPKGKGKSKGKKGFNGHYLDDMDGYFIGKGKGKGKSKGKYGQWLEGQASWMKGKNKGKEPSRTVNAYSSDLFLAGLEVAPTMDLSSMSASRADPQMGMLDSGATASAAPEAVVKGLVEAVLSRDRGARIDLEQYSRPYFRFGNGKWGRALGRTTITSNVSGHQRQFSLYTLPNPTEYYASHFDKSSLVPVLVGMDFLGPEGMGMAIDFSTGPDYCVCISDHNLCVLNSLMLQPRLLKCVDLPGLVDAGDDGEPTMEEVEVLDSNGDSLNFSDVNDVMLNEAGRITLETMAREARLRQVFTFQNLQMILNEFFSVAAPSANDNQRWRQAPSFNVALGAYSHGAFGGICKYTNKHLELVCYINAFIRHHQPLHQWSSLMVEDFGSVTNPQMVALPDGYDYPVGSISQ